VQAIIQLNQTGFHQFGPIETLATGFARTNTTILPGLIDASVLEKVSTRIRAANREKRIHEGISEEDAIVEPVAWNILHFLANTPQFLEAIRAITGCSQIRFFEGRIYAMRPGPQHSMSWHDDIVPEEPRFVGMSLNLSPAPFGGGVFEMREKGSKDISSFPNPVAGDALLFRVSEQLSHRVTDVVGSEPRIAYAGWFTEHGLGIPFRKLVGLSSP
jgi:hypothetical protein